MKYLGIDYGTKRIGVAVSDSDGKLAFPLTSFGTSPQTLRLISLLAARENAKSIIVGESKNFKGEHNSIMKDIEHLKKELEQYTGLPVEYEEEFFTSALAARQFTPEEKSRKANPKHKDIDASAAALILQSYLDKRRKVE